LDAIVLSEVKKSYSGVPAVRDLSINIREGEFLTLLGPSGCGKTTTLRMIAGLEDADDGEITVGGEVFFSREKGIYVPPEKRQLGFIFQSYALWPHMTVKKNISLGLEERKVDREKIENTVSRALEKVQLTGYENRYPSELSGGQQQRVAVARMIAAEHRVFLMDEPLSNLDAMLRIGMRTELKRLHHELGATTVYVTHDQNEALTLSDRIAVMDSGLLRQIGTPEEIYKKPADLGPPGRIGFRHRKNNRHHPSGRNQNRKKENYRGSGRYRIFCTSGRLRNDSDCKVGKAGTHHENKRLLRPEDQRQGMG